MGDQLVSFLHIGNIAAASSGDAELPAELRTLVDQQDGRTALRRCHAGHQAGRTAANDDDIIRTHERLLLQIRLEF
ncbi:hypothetical protein D3C71_1478930 [compost metagenome]